MFTLRNILGSLNQSHPTAPLLEKKGTLPSTSSLSTDIFDYNILSENKNLIFENDKSHLTSQMDKDHDQPSTTSSLVPTSLFSSTEILECLQKTPEIVDCCYLIDKKSKAPSVQIHWADVF